MFTFKVTFYPDKKSAQVQEERTLLSAALSAGAYINASCGGDGVCGKCKVMVKKGDVKSAPSGLITAEERKRHICLACMTTVHGDAEVEILPQSRLASDGLTPQEIHKKSRWIYSSSEEAASFLSPTEGFFKQDPLAEKIYLELPPPTLDDKLSDLERLYRQIRQLSGLTRLETGLANTRQLGEVLRAAGWKVTVTLVKKDGAVEVISIEPGDTAGRNFAFAFDIGTTTITGQLVDLNSGKILGSRSVYNKQISFGSDVITRIVYAQKAEGLEELHLAVTDCIGQIIEELSREQAVDLNDITYVLCAGNTTMMHLLLRIDPSHIRKEPYVATANFLPSVRAAEAGVRINPRGLLSCVPGVASYVGGDVTAGVLSCGMDREGELCLLIDIGTNGEIVLGNKEFLIACAASAGPAFEGSGVSCGMRASKGAIEKVKINDPDFNPAYEVVGGIKPAGICGSGYIDTISEFLRRGIIDKNGRINDLKNRRIRASESGKEFVVAFKGDSATGKDIVVTEADIDNIKRAKAAIYSAAAVLLRHMGIGFKEVKKIFIAGGFGNYLDMEKAIYLGLLPDLGRERFIFVGNSSISGARQILLAQEGRAKADQIAAQITYFELSVDPGYMDEYMAALFFPHTDLSRFPSFK